jgi:hypothetical protein
MTPTVSIVSGISSTVFSVSAGNIGKFVVGNLLIVRRLDWAVASQEVKVLSINTGTNQVTVAAPLKNTYAPFNTFTPDNTYVAEGLGFKDSQGFYRYN